MRSISFNRRLLSDHLQTQKQWIPNFNHPELKNDLATGILLPYCAGIISETPVSVKTQAAIEQWPRSKIDFRGMADVFLHPDVEILRKPVRNFSKISIHLTFFPAPNYHKLFK